jgi:guanine deaminase
MMGIAVLSLYGFFQVNFYVRGSLMLIVMLHNTGNWALQIILLSYSPLPCHTHDACAAFSDKQLDWLNKVTFPNEAKCEDTEYATMLYTRLVKRLLRNGTTTALYFATIHLEASKILANICSSLGQRGYVGKLNADQLSPDYYIETTASSLRDTESFIQYCQAEFPSTKARSSTVLPVITPRFIPTCSYRLLQGLGALAAKYDCHVQSHAAETVDQLTLVRQQYPKLQRDVEIFSSVGLLRPGKTVFAHCVHLHDAEVDHLARAKIGIAACPLSNILYSRGVVPVQRYLAKGARVGLGTDFGGGPAAGMLSAVRGAILADRTVEFVDIERGDDAKHWPENKECNWDVDFLFAYHLATVCFPIHPMLPSLFPLLVFLLLG